MPQNKQHDYDKTDLVQICEYGDFAEIKKFLEENTVHQSDLDRAFQSAAFGGHIKIMGILLKNNADIHANNDLALHYASNNGETKAVAFLLKNGADVHAMGDLAIRWAAKNKHHETMALLIKAGAQLERLSADELSEYKLHEKKKKPALSAKFNVTKNAKSTAKHLKSDNETGSKKHHKKPAM